MGEAAGNTCILQHTLSAHQSLQFHEVHIVRNAAAGIGIIIVTKPDAVGIRIDFHHEGPAVEVDADTLALSDGISDYTVMGSQDVAIHIHELSGFSPLTGVFFNEAYIVIVRDETYLLAV